MNSTTDRGILVIEENDVTEVKEILFGESRLYTMRDVKLALQVLKLVYAVRDTI